MSREEVSILRLIILESLLGGRKPTSLTDKEWNKIDRKSREIEKTSKDVLNKKEGKK